MAVGFSSHVYLGLDRRTERCLYMSSFLSGTRAYQLELGHVCVNRCDCVSATKEGHVWGGFWGVLKMCGME